MTTRRVAVPFAAVTAVMLAACGRSRTSSMDDGLKNDLAAVGGSSMELAPKPANQQMVVSAIEGGPTSAPARVSSKKSTAPKPVVRPPRRPVQSVAEAPAPAPAPTRVLVAPAPVEATPVEPPPLPPARPQATTRQQSRQAGPYKTEAEIFRQMPWIRP